MNLLAAACYDPAAAVSKATSALLAMTAFDTTNLRLAVTVPAHGKVRFRLMCTLTGATTFPVVLLGVLNGATVVFRATPTDFPGTANAATQTAPCMVDVTVPGLTPGATNFDAAYAVQVIVASTNFKYGGPNTNAGANAWGAFTFEAWDPQPMTANSTLAVDASGQVSANVKQVNGTAQTARDLGAQLDATVSSRMATYTQPTGFLAATFPTTVASPTNITAASGVVLSGVTHTGAVIPTVTNLTNAPTAGDLTATMKASVTTACTASTPTVADTSGTTTLLSRLTSTRAGLLDNLDATVSSRSTYAGGDTAGTTTLLGRLTALRAAAIDNLDATVSSRLPTSSYSAPPSAAAIRSEIDTNSAGLAAIFARTDVATSTRLAGASYTAPDNASVVAIKAKTDSLGFTVPGVVDAQILYVDGEAIVGSGTLGDPWKKAP